MLNVANINVRVRPYLQHMKGNQVYSGMHKLAFGVHMEQDRHLWKQEERGWGIFNSMKIVM